MIRRGINDLKPLSCEITKHLSMPKKWRRRVGSYAEKKDKRGFYPVVMHVLFLLDVAVPMMLPARLRSFVVGLASRSLYRLAGAP